jgi:hypothetical protein
MDGFGNFKEIDKNKNKYIEVTILKKKILSVLTTLVFCILIAATIEAFNGIEYVKFGTYYTKFIDNNFSIYLKE